MPSTSSEFRISSWRALEETEARTASPIYLDVTAAALANNSSYSEQLLHGTDYWRTVIDGASGIDIYGHNGVSVGDIDDDGFDDLYVCQPAGLPNRLYRNRGDGTFEDITDSSGLGILENTACALFADFSNDGRQDVIVVRANGPLFFLNHGGGKFRLKPDAFQFANPPQGTFTGAAAADYDRDGWLDIYFCLYSYYQGTGQYKYPAPYHDAENGPPNFLMRNQRDGTFRDVTADIRPQPEQHTLQFLLWMGRLQPRRLARSLCGQRFRAQESLSQQWRRKLHRCRRASGSGRHWRGHERFAGSITIATARRTSTLAICGPRPANASRPRKSSRKIVAEEIRAVYHKHAMGNSLLHNRGDDVFTMLRIRQEWETGAGHGQATLWISITTAFPISTSRMAWSLAPSREI